MIIIIIYIYIYIFISIEIFVNLYIWSKEVDQFDIIQRANYLSGTLGSWDVVLVTRSFPRLDQLSKICPKMWMMRLATWNRWFVGMMSKTSKETLRNICFQKTHFAQVIYFVWFFLQSRLPFVWYLLVVLTANPMPRSSSLAPSSWVQGSCCVELLWWKWEKWIRWRTSKIRSSANWWLDHPRTRIHDMVIRIPWWCSNFQSPFRIGLLAPLPNGHSCFVNGSYLLNHCLLGWSFKWWWIHRFKKGHWKWLLEMFAIGVAIIGAAA